jgi:zinc transporter ZupT
LIASYLYVVEIVHKPWGFMFKDISWWSAFTCLLGSVGYTVSSLYGFFGEGPIVIEQTWGNYAAVFLGAIFFFISSYLMIPESLDHPTDRGS